MSTQELGPGSVPVTVRVLLVEDNADDAALLERHLIRNGIAAEITRVETEEEMAAVLAATELPDIVLADYNLPRFSGPAALQTLKASGRAANRDLPFIMLSGAISEETAVASMRAGAHDYVSKQNLSRLVPAIQRELKEAATRRNRLAAEIALKASEARFHSLVEAMPMGLVISNAAGEITYANHAAERLLQFDPGELSGHFSGQISDPVSGTVSSPVPLSSICPSLAGAQSRLSRSDRFAQNALSSEPFESVCFTRNGNPVDVLVGTAFLNPEAPGKERQMASFLADLTLQKKSEEVLRRTDKLAIVGRLAASIAHEINNPLEATINCLYLVAQADLPEDTRAYLDLAQKELDRVAQITVQTLRFHRASTRPVETDIHELIESVLSLLDSRLRQLRVKIVRQFRANPKVVMHDGEIRQVLANLIGNAVDAVEEDGSIFIRTANARDWKQDREGIVISIADDGVGMDEATQKRIFEPFFSTKGNTGTGLGLWVSGEIVSKHHGRIRLRSRQRIKDLPGSRGGTIFRFFLPTPP